MFYHEQGGSRTASPLIYFGGNIENHLGEAVNKVLALARKTLTPDFDGAQGDMKNNYHTKPCSGVSVSFNSGVKDIVLIKPLYPVPDTRPVGNGVDD